MAKRISEKSNIGIIITAVLVIAVIAVCACMTESRWEILFKKAGLSEETDGCRMSVHFIDVGQGDCTVIKLESGESILIDSGEDIKSDKVKSYLKKEKIKGFDLCFLTHPHTDHYGAMADILADFPADKLIMPEIPEKLIPKEDEYREFISFVSRNVENVVLTGAGESFIAGGVLFEILAPLKNGEDLNSMSLVIKITSGSASFLITGDCTAEEENDILGGFDKSCLHCSVLKIGHHGSGNSTGSEWLDAVDPDAAVISVGRNNKYSHPDVRTLKKLDERKIKYYRTDICSDIVFKVNDDGIDVIY